MNRASRGMTLIELLVATLIMLVLGAGILTLVRSAYESQFTILNENNAYAQARQAIDLLADDLRAAKSLTAAADSDVTFRHARGTVRYWLDTATGRLLRTVDGAGTPDLIASGVTSLHLAYSSDHGVTFVTNPADPSVVGQVSFAVSVSVNGAQRQLSGWVKVRQKQT